MKLDELMHFMDGQIKVVESVTGKTVFEGKPYDLTLGEFNDLHKWLVGYIAVKNGNLFVAVDETII